MLRYVGGGRWLVGVPARDLGDGEVAALVDGWTPAALTATGLYRWEGDAPSETSQSPRPVPWRGFRWKRP